MPTMHDPAHPGESLRDVMLAEGWTVTVTAEKHGLHTADLLAAAQRSHRRLAGDGAGVGAYRVEQRSVLDTLGFEQFRQYSLTLENPSLLIVSDMVRFRIRTNWTPPPARNSPARPTAPTPERR